MLIALEDRVALLKRVGLFEQTEEGHLRRLAEGMTERSVPPEQEIIREGDPGTDFMVIVEGKVAIVKGAGADREILTILGPGQFFGEMALLDGSPRAAGALARSEVLLLVLDRTTLHGAIKEAPDILWRMAPTLTERLRSTSERLVATLNQMEAREKELQASYRTLEQSNVDLAAKLRRNVRVFAGASTLAMAVGLGIVVISSFGGGPATQAAPQEAASGGQSISVQPSPLVNKVAFSGKLEPARIVNLPSPIAASVAEVSFSFGSSVAQGDRLLRLDTSRLEGDIRDARAKLIRAEQELAERQYWASGPDVATARRSRLKAEAQLADSQRQMQETQFLFSKGIIPEQELIAAKQRADNARIDMAAADDALAATLKKGGSDYLTIARMEAENARSALNDLEAKKRAADMRAPMAGIVLRPTGKDGQTADTLSVGSQVTADQVLLSVGDVSSLKVPTTVDEFDVAKIKVGLPAEVYSEALDIRLKGRISALSAQPAAKQESSLSVARYPVEITIDAADNPAIGQLRLGMTVAVEVLIRDDPNAVIVPPSALITGPDGRPQVLRVSAQGQTEPVPVRLGGRFPAGVEILDGVAVGDRLALRR